MFSACLSVELCCHRAPSRQYGQLHKLPWPACRTQTSPDGSPPPGYHVVCGEEWWLMRRSRTFLPSEESSKPWYVAHTGGSGIPEFLSLFTRSISITCNGQVNSGLVTKKESSILGHKHKCPEAIAGEWPPTGLELSAHPLWPENSVEITPAASLKSR